MKGKLYCFMMVLQIVSWVSATSRSFAPNHGHGVHQPGTTQSPESLEFFFSSKKALESMRQKAEMNEEAYGNIGSSPPNCDHKCLGCIPCEAIQVPTTKSQVGVQYANYEPEGWKCKCGPIFYSP